MRVVSLALVPLALPLAAACASPPRGGLGTSAEPGEAASGDETAAAAPARPDGAPARPSALPADPSPRPELRAAWRASAHPSEQPWLLLENVGAATVRVASQLGAGEARCQLAEDACVALVPGARLERRCPTLRDRGEVRVQSCPPPGHVPHEVAVTLPPPVAP